MNDIEDGGTMNDRKTKIEEDHIPLMNRNFRLSVRDFMLYTVSTSALVAVAKSYSHETKAQNSCFPLHSN